jgi:oligosaccharide repeat unit polymerase
VVLLALPWLAAVLCRRVDALSPVLLFTFYVFVGYVLPIPSFLAGVDPVTASWTNLYGNFERSLTRAVWVTLVGVLGFYLGYAATRDLIPGKSAALDDQRPRWRSNMLVIGGFLYSVVGLGLFGLGVALIGGPSVLVSGLSSRVSLFAGLNYFFHAINLLLVVSLVWWARELFERRRPGRWFWLFTSLAVALAALQGSKVVLFVFAFTMVIMYHSIRRRLSLAKLALLAILFVPAISLYAIYIREFVVLGEIRSLDTSENWPLLLWLLVSRDFAGNFVELQALTIIVDRVPDVLDFQNGRTLLALLTIAVPSGLYPEKYLTAPGVFTLSIEPDRWVREGTTLPPGLMGEMYMNFGITGVFLGLLVFGAAVGLIRRAVKRQGHDPAVVITYALAVAMMAHYIRGEAVSPTVLLLILLLPTILLLKLVVRHRRPAPVRASIISEPGGEAVS